MSKFRRLRQRHDFDFKGTLSESYFCIDCGFDTLPNNLNRAESEQDARAQIAAGRKNWRQRVRVNSRSETYFVHDHVWKTAGMEPWGGCLCIGCLEKRIGRRLMPDDFADHVFNTYWPGTQRLLERQGRYDPLGDWDDAA
jgi:hypothetical protein